MGMTYNPNAHAATGSVGEAAVYLGASVIAMIAALTLEFLSMGVAPLFLVWLSASTFTLGIIEYRRSQAPPEKNHGPEV